MPTATCDWCGNELGAQYWESQWFGGKTIRCCSEACFVRELGSKRVMRDLPTELDRPKGG